MDRCIVTAASNKFFPSLINFLGSLHTNYPEHPKVYVYDLGLASSFIKELQELSWVNVLPVPHFVPHWRSCYTWKTYILNTPLAESNLYIDAGCQVLIPLNALFEEIESKGYMLISQGDEVSLSDIVPADYIELLDIKKELLSTEVVAAGIIGFKKNSVITPTLSALYASGIAGLCLGFSAKEQWKNKGVNKNSFVRNCPIFRHDTTMLSIFIRKLMPDVTLHPVEEFSGKAKNGGLQYLWNVRMNFDNLDFINSSTLHKSPPICAMLNRAYIKAFFLLKKINRIVKEL